MVRVYEFAREMNKKSKEVVAICQSLGIRVKAQSGLNVKQLENLKHYFNETSKNLIGGSEPTAVKRDELENKSVAYIVCECEPFTNFGKLGKRSAEIIKEIQKQGNNPVVILPKYSFIKKKNLDHILDVSVQVGHNLHQGSVFQLTKAGVTYLFIDDDFYFSREKIYGYEDDVERFTFFNRAILNCLPLLQDPIYDVYLNDWQTSIFALLLKVEYSQQAYYRQIKTNLTIHDLTYQGWCEAKLLSEVLGISEEYYTNGLTRLGSAVNLLKSGIETADTISLTKSSESQMKSAELVETGLNAILERNLKFKTIQGVK